MNKKSENSFICTWDSIYLEKKLCLLDLIILFKCIFDYSIIKNLHLNKQKLKKHFLNFELFYTLMPDEYLNITLDLVGIKGNKDFMRFLNKKNYGRYYDEIRSKKSVKGRKCFEKDEVYLDEISLEYIFIATNTIIETLIDSYFDEMHLISKNILLIPNYVNFENEGLNLRIIFDSINKWAIHEKMTVNLLVIYTEDNLSVELLLP